MTELMEAHVKSIIAELPDATTFSANDIGYETYDVNDKAAGRPTHDKAIHFVFIKNKSKDGWILDGYYKPE